MKIKEERPTIKERRLNDRKAVIFILSFFAIFIAFVGGNYPPIGIWRIYAVIVGAMLLAMAEILNKLPLYYTIVTISFAIIFGVIFLFIAPDIEYKGWTLVFSLIIMTKGLLLWAKFMQRLKIDSKYPIDMWYMDPMDF